MMFITGSVKTWRVVACLEEHNINIPDWPSRSLHLNPIENMWGLLAKNIQRQRLDLATVIKDTCHTIT